MGDLATHVPDTVNVKANQLKVVSSVFGNQASLLLPATAERTGSETQLSEATASEANKPIDGVAFIDASATKVDVETNRNVGGDEDNDDMPLFSLGGKRVGSNEASKTASKRAKLGFNCDLGFTRSSSAKCLDRNSDFRG